MLILMKKYFIVFLGLLSFSDFLTAQVDYTKTYYPLIMKAESAILDSNYQVSLSWYQQAFQRVPHGFARDHYNALICAVELGQFDIAFQLLDSLVAKGVKKSIFEKSVPLQALRKHPKWNFFIQTFEQKSFELNRNKNRHLKQILAGIDFLDQEFRSKKGSYKLYRDTINQIDKRNVQLLVQLIQQYGFPNEHLIGIESPFDIGLVSYIVFHHQCQKMSMGIHDFDFTDEMIKAVQKGELNPHQMCFWLSLQNRAAYQFGGTGIYQLFHKAKVTGYMVDKYSEKTKIVINQKRKELGIENLNEFYKKILFKIHQDQKGVQKFTFAACQVNEFVYAYQDAFEKALKNFEPIE
jgi:hypothetical protein